MDTGGDEGLGEEEGEQGGGQVTQDRWIKVKMASASVPKAIAIVW